MAGLFTLSAPASKLVAAVLKKLVKLNYIKSYERDGNTFKIELLYNGKQPAVTEVKIFSKPGRRFYVTYRQIKPVLGGMGHSLLSTSKGIMSGREAKLEKIGGELLFEIW